jgi:very-short-patch-repair endonuclease
VVNVADLNPETRRALFSAMGAKGRKIHVSQESSFAFQCRVAQLPELVPQYRFAQSKYPGHRRRVWIADFAFLELGVMVEIDGGLHVPGMGHSRATGIERSMRKQNDAALLGFVTLRFTPAQVKSGEAIGFTEKVLCQRQKC